MKDLNPKKYLELIDKLQQEAKAESIALLQDRDNHFLDFEDIEPEDYDSCWIIPYNEKGTRRDLLMYAYGLNEKGQLCFKAEYRGLGFYYEEGKWCDFEEKGFSNLYCKVYEIIANYILKEQTASS